MRLWITTSASPAPVSQDLSQAAGAATFALADEVVESEEGFDSDVFGLSPLLSELLSGVPDSGLPFAVLLERLSVR